MPPDPQPSRSIQLFTDGACLGNPGPGGWAYILRDRRDRGRPTEVERAGGEANTTNNRMELIAVVEGLHAIASERDRSTRAVVELCSDSQYVLHGIRDWMPNWKAKGWRLAGGNKPVKNVDLWRELDALLGLHDVRVTWVRGHAGHPENERCDQLASAEAAEWARGHGRSGRSQPKPGSPTGQLF